MSGHIFFKISTFRISLLDILVGQRVQYGDFILFKFISLISSASLPPVPSPVGCLTGIQGSDSGPHSLLGEVFLGSCECAIPLFLLLLSFSATVLVRAV